MNKNYTILHLHSDLSNATTTMDSVTKYTSYIDKVKELGMKAVCFTEHGNIFEWVNKKKYCDKNGVKYIHGVETYITETLEEKIRDNYHCVLIAKNYDGVKEINKLVSNSFNRKDNHFHYNPRISFDELKSTSDNIIVSSACLGGVLRNTSSIRDEFIEFATKNKHRFYLELQHHPCREQLDYNNKLIEIHRSTGIPILVTTDTHSLNKDLANGRTVLQRAKNIHFEDEDSWDTVFKSYDEIISSFNKQGFEHMDLVEIGLENTNKIADIVEDFKFDLSFKYPHVYENPKDAFIQLVKDGAKKRGVKIDGKIKSVIMDELRALDKTQQIDYLLLVEKITSWARDNGMFQGYGRGSINGSYVAYLLGITEMDSIKWDLNFFRYCNPNRVSLPDVDLDWFDKDREKLLEYLLEHNMYIDGIKTAKIITFNTIALKGAIRDVGRAFNMPLNEVGDICDNIENNEDIYRKDEKYKNLFKFVDMLMGVIVSIGSHPAGVIITDKNMEEEFGLCTLGTTEHLVSCINMKEVDYLGYVKMDMLGLDNMGLINETCKLIGINRLTPDNTPEFDEDVWRSIAEDTTLVFQWESPSSEKYVRGMLEPWLIEKLKSEDKNFSYIDWISFGNGLIRPACESYRDDILTGNFYDNGLYELNEFLKPTRGRLSMQEDIMNFLTKFCGYTGGESDEVRRAIGKKLNTEELTPEIERRFIEHTSKTYNVDKEKCAEVIKPFIQVIIDASNYSFSWNHAKPYTWIGYIGGYLRYHYPLETLTTALNIFADKEDKSSKVINYINQKTDIKISSIKFGKSKAEYAMDKSTNTIYKGIGAIKYLSLELGNELSVLYNNKYDNFLQLLIDINSKTSCNSNQLSILIKLDYFSDFGKSQYLLDIVQIYDNLNGRKQIKKDQLDKFGLTYDIMERHANSSTAKMYKDFDCMEIIKEMIEYLEDKDISLKEKISHQLEYLGYIQYRNDTLPKSIYYVLETKFYDKYKEKPYLKLYRILDGETISMKIKNSNEFNNNHFQEKDIIKIEGADKEQKTKKNADGKYEKVVGEFNLVLTKWKVL